MGHQTLIAVLLAIFYSSVDAFSSRITSNGRWILAPHQAATTDTEKSESRPGAVIKDWNALRVPTVVKPYGLNVAIDDQTLKSTPKDGVVTSIVWAFGGEYVHPELRQDFPVGQWLNERPSLGIALSGGGMRAASTCLGWLRGLNELGLLSKARYVSSNSGATWVTMPLAAKQLLEKKEHNISLDYERMLGKYVEPEDISGSEEELGTIGKVLRDSDILTERESKKARSYSQPDGKSADFTAWVRAIDENFVQPMGIPPKPDFLLEMGDAYLWNDVKRLDDNTFPFPIFAGTAYPDVKDPRIAVPFEFTPLYIGIPMDPRIHGNPTLDCSGGYTQSIAFNTHVIDKNLIGCPPWTEKQHPLHLYQLPLPIKVFKATEMTGISSSFFAAEGVETGLNLGAILRWIPFIPEFLKQFPNPESYKYWSPVSGGMSTQLQFADGGLYDNTGVLGLLRRGCKTIIACVSSDSAVVVGNPQARFSDIAALFGRAEEGKTNIGSVNEMQVFDSEKWDELLADLRQKYEEGKPRVCRMQLKFHQNKYAGVYDTGTVEVYFCLNGRCDEWINRLGSGANAWKKKMKPGWFGPFIGPESTLSVLPGLFSDTQLTNHFPYFSTFRVIYDQDVVNAMAHNCAYAIKTGLEACGFNSAFQRH